MYIADDEAYRSVLSKHKHTKTLFALKYINKQKCVKMKAVANIVQERRLLEEVRLCRSKASDRGLTVMTFRLTIRSS